MRFFGRTIWEDWFQGHKIYISTCRPFRQLARRIVDKGFLPPIYLPKLGKPQMEEKKVKPDISQNDDTLAKQQAENKGE